MLDERGRRIKAAKIVAVVEHFLGRSDLEGLRVLDIGCSGGIITSVLAEQGAEAFGVDIDARALLEARQRSAPLGFVVGDGEAIPFSSHSFDVAIFNQSYEHVVDPRTVVAEIRRVLRPTGIVYIGAHSRLAVFEPHYHLPFLSWLSPKVADRYLRITGKGDHYHERFLTRRRLAELFAVFSVWDYSYTVIAEPQRFGARDVVGRVGSKLVRLAPARLRRLLSPLLPGWVWIGSPSSRAPDTSPVAIPPDRVATRASN